MPTTRKFIRFTRAAVCLAAMLAVAATSARAADDIKASSEIEQELLAILRSEAPGADKAIACKQLAIHGSDAAVPDLAKLLSDAQFASWARIALEAIPGSVVDEALRKATDSLDGNLLVGTINSICVRRDANAVEILATRLQDKDAEVASAAAVALGRIGNASAAKSLRQSLASAPANVRSAVAEGCVLCAERLHSTGKSAEAVAIYDEVRKADVPQQRIIEGTRGAILARSPQEGLPLLLEQFRSTDKALFQLALGTAREFPGSDVDKALAAEMARATPDRAALIIQAMADRKETVVLAAVLEAAGSGPKRSMRRFVFGSWNGGCASTNRIALPTDDFVNAPSLLPARGVSDPLGSIFGSRTSPTGAGAVVRSMISRKPVSRSRIFFDCARLPRSLSRACCPMFEVSAWASTV